MSDSGRQFFDHFKQGAAHRARRNAGSRRQRVPMPGFDPAGLVFAADGHRHGLPRQVGFDAQKVIERRYLRPARVHEERDVLRLRVEVADQVVECEPLNQRARW